MTLLLRGLLIATLTFSAFLSCTTGPKKKTPLNAPPVDVQTYKKAKALLKSGQSANGLAILKKLAQKQPTNDVTDDAYFLMANFYYSRKNYTQAYRNYLPIIKSEFQSPKEAKAYLKSAYCLKYNGQSDEALGLISRGLNYANMDNATKVEAHELKGSMEQTLGDYPQAVESYAFLVQNHPNLNKRKQYLERGLNLIETKIPTENLQSVMRSQSLPPEYIASANFKYGEYLYNNGETDKAYDYFKKVIAADPSSSYAERARALFVQIKEKGITDPYAIGVILPLTGKHKHIGQKALKGIQLGLGLFGNGQTPFKVAVFDSQSNPEIAAKGVEKLVTEDHVIAIVGGLLSKTSIVVAQLCNKYRIPNISLSQKSKLTNIGDFVFRNAITSELQIRMLVKTAMEKRNIKSFAVLYPNDRYGTEYANIFWDEVRARGGNITAAQSYQPNETDFRNHVKKLVGIYYMEDRQAEYKFHLNKWHKKQRGYSRNNPPDDLLPPIVNFQALFIPDNTKALGQIAPMLNYFDVQNITLMGTNIWNQPSLITRGQQYVEGALFVEDRSVFKQAYKNTKFYKKYIDTFEEEPSTFSAQSYDIAKLLSMIIKSGEKRRVDVRRRLASLKSFTGAKGKVIINSRREMVSPLISLTVKDSEISTVE